MLAYPSPVPAYCKTPRPSSEEIRSKTNQETTVLQCGLSNQSRRKLEDLKINDNEGLLHLSPHQCAPARCIRSFFRTSKIFFLHWCSFCQIRTNNHSHVAEKKVSSTNRTKATKISSGIKNLFEKKNKKKSYNKPLLDRGRLTEVRPSETISH